MCSIEVYGLEGIQGRDFLLGDSPEPKRGGYDIVGGIARSGDNSYCGAVYR